MVVDENDGRAGWLMNRMSLHEPIVIFNVESVRLLYNYGGGTIMFCFTVLWMGWGTLFVIYLQSYYVLPAISGRLERRFTRCVSVAGL